MLLKLDSLLGGFLGSPALERVVTRVSRMECLQKKNSTRWHSSSLRIDLVAFSMATACGLSCWLGSSLAVAARLARMGRCRSLGGCGRGRLPGP